tara:strand:- start:1173 stop:1616 length:444 start_codon:yes stop_codon:yes gene_type:complete
MSAIINMRDDDYYNNIDENDENDENDEIDGVCSICLSKKYDDEICTINNKYIIKSCECVYFLHKHCIIEWVNKTGRTKCLMCPEIITLNESYYKRIWRLIVIKKCLINKRICMLVASFLMRLWILNTCIIIVYNISLYTYQFNRMLP